MATYNYAPAPLNDTFLIPGGNTVGNGVQLFLYAAGSTTKQTAYKDNLGSASWPNPIVLDSGGNLPNAGALWFQSGLTYKAVYAPSNDSDPPASPYRTIDNLSGINDTTVGQSEWVAGPAPTFVNASQFTLVGDQTNTFTKSRRVKFTVTAGTVYGTITSSAFSVNTTTVNVALDSGALDSGLSAVSYGVIGSVNPSISSDEISRKGSSVSSATNGTTDIWGIAGDFVHITGTTAINSFSSAPYTGALREIVFDAALPLNNGAGINIPGSANVTTAANDRAIVRADTTSSATIMQYKGGDEAPYQSGNWTPSLGGSATYTIQNGRWTKTGRVVFVEMDLQINAIGTGSSTTVSGLPFSCNSSNPATFPISFWSSINATPVYLSGLITASASTIVFEGITAAGNTLINISPWQNGARIICSGFYSSP